MPSTKKTTILLAVAVAGIAAGSYACNAIIGTRDNLTFESGDGGTSALGDGSTVTGEDGASGGGDGGGAGQDGASNADAATPCTDTTADPENCGKCGHSCGGGKCAASVCQPLVLAQNLVNVIAMTLDTTSVYWSDQVTGAAYSVPKAGGTKTTLATSLNQPWGLASDGTNLYIASYVSIGSGGGVYACKATGCTGTGAAKIAAGDMTRWLVMGTNQVLYALDFNAVERIDLSKMPPTQKPIADANNGFHITADANYVYFTDYANTIHATPITADGGPAALDFGDSSGNFPGDIAVDGTNVYWTYGNPPPTPGKVYGRLKTGTGNSITYGAPATTAPLPLGIASDGTNVYWVTLETSVASDDGALVSCPVAGCTTPTTILSGLAGPNTVILDGAFIYVAVAGDDGANNGQILRLAKP